MDKKTKLIVYYPGSGLDFDYISQFDAFDKFGIRYENSKIICIDPLEHMKFGRYWFYKNLKLSASGDHLEFVQCPIEDYKREESKDPETIYAVYLNGWLPTKMQARSFFREGDIVFVDTKATVRPSLKISKFIKSITKEDILYPDKDTDSDTESSEDE